MMGFLPSSPFQKRSIIMSTLVAYIVHQKVNKKAKKKIQMTDDDGKLTRKAITNFGKAEMWKIFLPTSFTSEGVFELTLIACFHVYRVYQVGVCFL
jgi:hypothetical protein